MKIKTAAEIASKWANVTPARAAEWQAGIKATSTEEYAAAAVASAPAWESGVQDAASRGAYASGVDAGKSKWQRKALAVGVGRYGPGVRAAQADQQAGFAPYRDVIASLALPPRGPRGAPGNYDRVRQVGEALNAKRTGG